MAVRFLQPLLLAESPFAGEGVSLYAAPVGELAYRNEIFFNAAGVIALPEGSRYTSEEDLDIPLPRTLRVASAASPEASIDFTLPEEWYGGEIAVNLRVYKDGFENENTDVRTITIDAEGEPEATLSGTATLLGTEPLVGGIVLIRWSWVNTGTLTPDHFLLVRTAGPTTPDDQQITYLGDTIYNLETEELSDAGSYTFKLVAVSGEETVDVLTGIVVTPDATGPSPPTGDAIPW